jgi:DNA-binding NtrC family response regulator
MAEKEKILVVDDDVQLLDTLYDTLTMHDFLVSKASNGEEALEKMQTTSYDLVITDVMMENIDGITLLKEIKKNFPDVLVIVVSGHGGIDVVIEATRAGAYDFIPKPFSSKEIILRVEKGLEYKRKELERDLLNKRVKEKYSFNNMISKNSTMINIFNQTEDIAQSDATVLIIGETGTGKELIANAIHCNSRRKDKPFVVINCAAISETLLESELFGHEKGAFTGAFKQKKGRFEIADGGTVFLDEVGDVPLSIQVKLLRILQQKEFERVGGTDKLTTDIRVIAATNRNLSKLIEDGLFREDLFYRLNVFPVQLPPLRDRKEDIPILAEHFIKNFNQRHSTNIETISKEALEQMLNYSWPGNIRELENVLERAALVTKTSTIENMQFMAAVPAKKTTKIEVENYKEFCEKVLASMEKEYLIDLIRKYNKDVGVVIAKMQISKKTFYNRINEYGIDLKNV